MPLAITLVNKLLIHQGSIYSVIQGENENCFFSAGSEGVVIKWNVDAFDQPSAIAKVNGQIFSLLFLPEKNHLIIGTMSGGLHVIDLNAKQEIHYITYHDQSIFDMKAFGKRIFVCSKDGTLSVWNADTYQLEKVMTVSNQSLRTISFHPQKQEAAIGSSDNRIYLLDMGQMQITSVLEGPDNSVFSLCYSRNGNELIAGSRDAQLYVYELNPPQLRQQIKAHLYTINHLVPILEGRFIASASRDKTIRIWDTENFELQKSLDKEKYDGHLNSVNRLLWLPTPQYLVSCSDDRSVIVWKVEQSNLEPGTLNLEPIINLKPLNNE